MSGFSRLQDACAERRILCSHAQISLPHIRTFQPTCVTIRAWRMVGNEPTGFSYANPGYFGTSVPLAWQSASGAIEFHGTGAERRIRVESLSSTMDSLLPRVSLPFSRRAGKRMVLDGRK